VRAQTRTAAREFSALPAEIKARYAITVGGRRLDPARRGSQRERGGHGHAAGPEGIVLAGRRRADGERRDRRPLVPAQRLAALTVDIGGLLARWTGNRWRSTRHRVLPPQAEAPDEDLLSLIFFYEASHDAVVESLPAPIGRTSFPPVIAHEYVGEKLDAIGVT
jgi:isopenicillin N synthase-like dioxygenase